MALLDAGEQPATDLSNRLQSHGRLAVAQDERLRYTERFESTGNDIPQIVSTKKTSQALERDSSMAIAVDPVALITTECISVTSAMRKNARWAQSSVAAILGGSTASEDLSHPFMPQLAAGQQRPRNRRDTSEKHAWASDSAVNGENGPVNRWGLRGRRGKSLQDNPLMSAFSRLRGELRDCVKIQDFDTPSLLHPFLQVIRSSSTSASITSLALVAITRFFTYNLIAEGSPRLSLGMQLLSAAVTHCRFEASDSAADEIVLLRILRLMEIMLSSPGGALLSDESVCEMMESGLSMCCQGRLSELLRRSAEMSMVTMCQILFQRLRLLERESSDGSAAFEANLQVAGGGELRMDTPLKSTNVVVAAPSSIRSVQSESPVVSRTLADAEGPPENLTDSQEDGETHESDERATATTTITAPLRPEEAAPKLSHDLDIPIATRDAEPYSLPSIRELFRVLVNLLDPHEGQHTDVMRIMALRIIDVALEVAGPSVSKHPSLAVLAKDNLCRHLFQLVRSENVGLLNESLRVAGTLLESCRGVLKLQQELFLSYLVACLHPRIEIPPESGIDPSLYEGVPQAPKAVKPAVSSTSSGRSTPVPVRDRQKLGLEGGARKPDAREAMIESVGALARIPYFMPELFINYDCEVDRGDLCEDLVGLLARNSFPDSATWSTTNVPPLCLDALLGYVQYVAERLHDEPSGEHLPDRETLLKRRDLKKVIVRGATKFNENPKGGIAYLATQSIINDPDDPVSIAKFLKGTARISKRVLGDYISKKANQAVLGAFIDLFDFSGKRVDEALRDLLGAFRLPGESALIERIVTVFSDKYCANSTPEGVADKDAVFVLTYAIIMLNTDQHSPNVKAQSRMTFESFAKNLRGVNSGQDFDHAYLQEIFDSIRTNEIILPDEHDNRHAFDHAWQELLSKAEGAGDFITCKSNLFDADMFAATWSPVIATLSYVFMSASEDATTVYHRVVAGFDQCAQIASRYGITQCLDRIIRCLCTISTLASSGSASTSLNTEVQVKDKSIMVSELAVRFGRDYKAQLATVVLFRGVVAGNEASIREGWKDVAKTLQSLFVNSLHPSAFASLSALLGTSAIPLRSPSQIISREKHANGNGLFQSFTSYLASYAADDPPEPSESEISDTLCTYDCLGACPIEKIFQNLLAMPSPSISALVTALLDQIPHDPTPFVAKVKPENGLDSPGKPTTRQAVAFPEYDPCTVFSLELATIIAVKNDQMSSGTEKAVLEGLQSVVRNATGFHPTIISRAAFYLLNVLHAKHGRPFVRTPVILHCISSLAGDVLRKAALLVLQGLSLCLEGSTDLRGEFLSSPDFWATLRHLHAVKEASPTVFAIIVPIVTHAPSNVTADNYEAIVHLLHEAATLAGESMATGQRSDRGYRKGKHGKVLSTRDAENLKRGVQAVDMIYQLSSRVPVLIEKSHLERKDAWSTYWSPIFQALSAQCLNPCREIRQQAFSSLQRSLLSPKLASPDHQEWTAIFGEVLFPLILQLLKPEVYHLDPHGMGETRVQAATLLCRIFLHYLVLLSEWEGMLELWLKILDIMDRLMNSGQGDSLDEAVPESLKNVLLVMASGGYLVPPTESGGESRLWDETWRRLERFSPGLYRELYADSDLPGKPYAAQQSVKSHNGQASTDTE